MADWWFILVAVLVGVTILGVSLYLVVAYGSPYDRMRAWFPKAVVLFAFSLAATTVLLLPYDVANRKHPDSVAQYGGGLDTQLMWQIILWTDAVVVVVIVPFATFYYEAWDPEQYSLTQQIGPAFTYTLFIVIAFGALVGALWATEGVAIIPYWSYTAPAQYWHPLDAHLLSYVTKTVERIEIPVSFFVYAVAVLLFIGWIFFCFFGGVGLVCLPVDLFWAFHRRPQPISTAVFNEIKERIAWESERLIGRAKQLLKETAQKSARKKINALRLEVRTLEKELDRAIIAHEDRGFGPLKSSLILFVGVICLLLSLTWVLHIFIYNATHTNPFLNTWFILMDKSFALLGVAAYALFAFYLMWAAVRGCFKLGVRIVIFQIHPMKLGDTLANALLFNSGVVLLTSVIVTQFCVLSFDSYASNTALDGLLNLWVMRLKGIGIAMFYFQFAFVGIAVLTALWFIVCPRRKPKKVEDDDD